MVKAFRNFKHEPADTMKILSNKTVKQLLCLVLAMGLTSCATMDNTLNPGKSYLSGSTSTSDTTESAAQVSEEEQVDNDSRFRFVPPLKLGMKGLETANDLISQFGTEEVIEMTTDALSLSEFLHQVFGTHLKVNYMLAEEVKRDNKPVTLNLQNAISQQRLFGLTEDILRQRQMIIRYDDEVFYIHPAQENGANSAVVYGYGKTFRDVPRTSQTIIQLIPFEFGVQPSLNLTLKQLIGVNAKVDIERGTMTIKGKRREILQALELIQLLDRPAFKDRQIAIYETIFLSTDDLVSKLDELLAQEGMRIGEGTKTENALSAVQLEKQGMVVFFANNRRAIVRALDWAKRIDKPANTLESQYFIYQPKYSRAIDMGESLNALFGYGSGVANNTSSTSVSSENNQRANNNRSPNRNTAAVRNPVSKDLQMVVDERANALIFYTSGETYQQILPMIQRLDVLPKQVLLEVMIAEVTLTDEFKQGVEFALSKGRYSASTSGAFMGDGFGGLSYLFQGTDGQVAMNLLQTNSLVNLISRPTVVVRDGVTANINVGTDIPIIGQTTSDPLTGQRQTTSNDYRKTGVELNVRPTINAQGVILMEITQRISNEVPSSTSGTSNPAIFERSIQTEVVTDSGQTIMLGGLISENESSSDSKVPVLGDIPLLGNLFKGKTKDKTKTELVVLITPKIIASKQEWDEILDSFSKNLTNVTIN
jgi:general secretion pathway protein D